MNTRSLPVKYLFKYNQDIIYWKVIVELEHTTLLVITNAKNKYDAYISVLDEYKHANNIEVIGAINTTNDVENPLWIGETQLVNIYSRSKSGMKLIKTIKHYILPDQTHDVLYHFYSRLFSDYYVSLISENRTKRIMIKHKRLQLVKQLRDETQSSYKVCIESIDSVYDEMEGEEETDAFFQKLYQTAKNKLVLSKQVIANKKSNNVFNEFIIKYNIITNGGNGVMIKFGMESEQGKKIFQKNQIYDDILNKITEIYYDERPNSIRDLLSCKYDDTKTIRMKLAECSGELSENIGIYKIGEVELPTGCEFAMTSAYNHNDRIGGLAIFKHSKETDTDILRKILHQIVSTNPLCINENELLPSIVDYQRSIVEKEILADGKKKKPEVLDKVIEGKLQKFKADVVITNQPYMFGEHGGKDTVKKVLEKASSVLLDFVVL